jgi:peptidoglycan/LPS O-acetylase OafA/YrhL
MPTYWFKPKRYGYGATPVTWQGWAITAASVLVVAIAALLILDHNTPSPWAWTTFFAVEAAIIAILCVISRRKTDGDWRWRWGD